MMIGGTKPQCWQQIDLAAELLFDPLCDCRHKIRCPSAVGSDAHVVPSIQAEGRQLCFYLLPEYH